MDHAITRATGAAPSTTPPATARRTWAILLTSANHGVVGPLGSTFPHAGEHHERVQVVELVEAGAPPAPDADLAGLLRFNMAGEPVAIEGAAPVAAQAGQVAVPGWISVDDRLPSVPENSDCQFIVACRRANGKTYVFAASYLNALELDTNDDGDAVFTGWYTEGEHPEYSSWYEPVCQAGDEVTHWQELPAAPSQASTAGERQEGGAA
jgi:hypothetical protein